MLFAITLVNPIPVSGFLDISGTGIMECFDVATVTVSVCNDNEVCDLKDDVEVSKPDSSPTLLRIQNLFTEYKSKNDRIEFSILFTENSSNSCSSSLRLTDYSEVRTVTITSKFTYTDPSYGTETEYSIDQFSDLQLILPQEITYETPADLSNSAENPLIFTIQLGKDLA